jgi:pimeloyl-ACP methyl ester carboxylesterase
MKIYYRESGNTDAPLIVFLHGGGVSGHGLSSTMNFTIDDTAKEILALIQSKLTYGLTKNRFFSKLQV